MQTTQPPLFYVIVWDRFPDAPATAIHPHFTKHHAYPVLHVFKRPVGDPEFLIPDDRLHLRFVLATDCTLVNDHLMSKKDQP